MEREIFRILLKHSDYLSALFQFAWLYLWGGPRGWHFQNVTFHHFLCQNYYLWHILMRKCRKRFLSTIIFIGNTFFILFTMKILFEKVSCNVLLCSCNSWRKSRFIYQSTSYFEVKITISQLRITYSELLVWLYFSYFTFFK